ncbi:MAG: hypothetical protein HZB46_14410 [Solirubrobacterales bacterium]|nr:hypothetical protein [Solirubrobacterales bacterium]
MTIVKPPRAAASFTGTPPHGNDRFTASASAGVSIVTTGVAFWKRLGSAK